MSLPITEITITKTGVTTVKSLEQSDQCYKLKDFARQAGKIVSEIDKEHPPVIQTVSQKGN